MISTLLIPTEGSPISTTIQVSFSLPSIPQNQRLGWEEINWHIWVYFFDTYSGIGLSLGSMDSSWLQWKIKYLCQSLSESSGKRCCLSHSFSLLQTIRLLKIQKLLQNGVFYWFIWISLLREPILSSTISSQRGWD